MPDHDDASLDAGSDHDDPGVAAERLERALERIAASAHRAASGAPPPGAAAGTEPIMAPGSTREVAARLDALIAQLRTALDRD